MTSDRTFTLRVDNWYAWQMLPGYIDEHYFSPIRVNRVIPKKSGDSLLRLKFFNAAYAAGVQNFDLELKVLARAENYMVAALQYEGTSTEMRSAVISPITFRWIEKHFPGLFRQVPLEKNERAEQHPNAYLERYLRRSAI